jgi:hypothetical protein
MTSSLERSVLLAPDAITRRLAGVVSDPEQRWMLRQPRAVRASFVAEALDGDERAQQIWMLRQPDEVRESYIRDVLGA